VPGAEGQVAAVARYILGRAHRVLDRLLLRVETIAEVAGTFEVSELSGVVDALLHELDKTLLPHMAWEEQVRFPAADRLAATPWATQVLRLQHDHVRRSLEQLRTDCLALHVESGCRAVVELRAHLDAFHTTLTAHLDQEEPTLSSLVVAETAACRHEDA
jgi:iron-sulfur cluster repair protein YtfE (RIC family)